MMSGLVAMIETARAATAAPSAGEIALGFGGVEERMGGRGTQVRIDELAAVRGHGVIAADAGVPAVGARGAADVAATTARARSGPGASAGALSGRLALRIERPGLLPRRRA